MAVRDWSARRLRLFWLHGLVAELTVIAISVVIGRATRPPEAPLLRQMHAVADSQERGLLPPPELSTPAERAELRQLLHDSLGLDIVRRGDSVHLVPINARGDSIVQSVDSVARSVARLTAGFSAATGDAVRAALWVVAAVLLPIPTVVLAITLFWGWSWWRRRSVPGPA